MCLSTEIRSSQHAQSVPSLSATTNNTLYYHSDRCHTLEICMYDAYELIPDKFELRNFNFCVHQQNLKTCTCAEWKICMAVVSNIREVAHLKSILRNTYNHTDRYDTLHMCMPDMQQHTRTILSIHE